MLADCLTLEEIGSVGVMDEVAAKVEYEGRVYVASTAFAPTEMMTSDTYIPVPGLWEVFARTYLTLRP